MTSSLIYKSESMYELAMLFLYGRHYADRYLAIAGLIPAGASVLDLCCGPAVLYHRYLRLKSVTYTGLDINPRFIDRLNRRGGDGRLWDLRKADALPPADYVIMQASLYHFLPDASPVVDRMLEAARKRVIVAEPIRNLTAGDSKLLSVLGRLFTNPGTGQQPLRFTEATLSELFSAYSARIVESRSIAGGREKMFVLK